MDIQRQLEILMSGTEYGDDELKAAMAKELGERLAEAEKAGRRSRSIPATTRAQLTCTWVIPSPCARCASSRIWVTRLPS